MACLIYIKLLTIFNLYEILVKILTEILTKSVAIFSQNLVLFSLILDATLILNENFNQNYYQNTTTVVTISFRKNFDG